MDTSLLDEIARRYGLEVVVQFGSTVRGREHPRSDLDLAVLSRHGLTFDQQLELAGELQRALPGPTVDLVLLDHADPLLLKQVTDSCRLLAGSTRRLAELRMLAFRRYQDHRRFFAMERAYVERFLKGAR